MVGDIVPIELGLTENDIYTLWAPNWRDGDEEFEGFLGVDENLFGFTSVAALTAFVRSGAKNDLTDHPQWKTLLKVSAEEFEPTDEHRFDLIGVPQLATQKPSNLVLSQLDQTLTITRILGEVCELNPVIAFFESHPMFNALAGGAMNFVGRDGQAYWNRIGEAIAQGWDKVVDTIDDIIVTPEVDAEAVSLAEAELLAAAESIVDTDDITNGNDDEDIEELDLDEDDESLETTAVLLVDDDDLENAATVEEELVDDLDDELEEDFFDEEATFWTEVGIDPIKIVTSQATYYTLRCYLDDGKEERVLFLGHRGTITVFRSPRLLAHYLAEHGDSELAAVSTYEEVQIAAIDGSLEIEPTQENIYILPGLTDDLLKGPQMVDPEQLELAVELVSDAAEFAGDEATLEALASSTPLGWYISYLIDPKPSRLAPSPPYDEEVQTWRVIEHAFESRLVEG